MRKLLLIIFLLSAMAARCADLTASLVTCWPGPEVYELCGHEALRIRGTEDDGTPVDSVWNYGVFDFAAPGFLYRFVKGETDYMLAGYPFPWFLADYTMRGSKVAEQDLNLTPAQVAALRKRLQTEALPQNRVYRYNYVRDNCSTRIVDRIGEVTGDSISYEAPASFANFRDGMRHYHRNYPWYQFGIDLVLGSGLDRQYTPRDEMFLPLELHRQARTARFADGRPMVKGERILNAGTDNVLPPTPWYLTPMAMAVAVFLFSVGVSLWEARIRRPVRWWMALYFGAAGLTGCVVTFLYFFSTHEATSPNLLILWLNPMQLLVPALIWVRRARPVVRAMMWLNIVVVCVLLISWPFQPQSANPAIFPLLGADLALALTWTILALRGRAELPVSPSAASSPRRASAKSGGSRTGRASKISRQSKK